jgi:translocator protein
MRENIHAVRSRPNFAPQDGLGLLAWLAFCFAAALTGLFVSMNGWYQTLNMPSWNPPSWLFGPVWTVLYVMMAVAAWLVWKDGGWTSNRRALGAFCVQWVFNLLWTPIFFGAHRPGLAFMDIVLLWLSLAATVVLFWRARRLAGALLIPYLAWVTFAAVLNFTIWRMNS